MEKEYTTYIDLLKDVFEERKMIKKPEEEEWAEAILHYLGPDAYKKTMDTISVAGSAAAGAAVGGTIAASSTSLLTSIGVALGVISSPVTGPAIVGAVTGVALLGIGKNLFKKTRKRTPRSLKIQARITRAGSIFNSLNFKNDYSKIQQLKQALIYDFVIEID